MLEKYLNIEQAVKCQGNLLPGTESFYRVVNSKNNSVVSKFTADLKAACRRFRLLLLFFVFSGGVAGAFLAAYCSSTEYRCVSLLYVKTGDDEHAGGRGRSLAKFIRHVDREAFILRLEKHLLDTGKFNELPEYTLDIENIGSIRLLKIIVESKNAEGAVKIANAAAELILPDLREFTRRAYVMLSADRQDAISQKNYYWDIVFYLLSGVFGGLLAGMILVYFIELFYGGIRNIRNLGRELELPILCVLPEAGYCLADENFFRNEAINLLQRNIGYLLPQSSSGRILLLAELFPRLRDLSFVYDLAGAMQSGGKRILLIDADMRKKKRCFLDNGASGNSGLAGILQGKCTFAEVVMHDDASGIDMLERGTVLKNPGSFFLRRKMEDFLLECSRLYDYVIIIGAPMQCFTDSLVLSRLADCTLLICDQRRNNMNELKLVLWRLEKAKSTCGGLIIHSAGNLYENDDCCNFLQ